MPRLKKCAASERAWDDALIWMIKILRQLLEKSYVYYDEKVTRF